MAGNTPSGRRELIVAGLAAFLCGPWCAAQIARKRPAGGLSEAAAPPTVNLRVDSNLVLVPAVVYNSERGPVTGLEKGNFRLYEDDVEQTITSLSLEDQPLTIGLLFDTSGSMVRKLWLARRAASEFFAIANPEDDYFLIEFGDGPKLSVPLTQNVGEIQNRLLFTRSRGQTALIDAVVLALNELKKSKKSMKALLVVSDGGDNNSRYSEVELRHLVRESDALIYGVGVYGNPSAPEEVRGPGLLRQIATQTGGRAFEANAFELPDIAVKIGIELRSRYILGYKPTNAQRDGRYRSIQVKVIPPRGFRSLRVSWRHGYYAAGGVTPEL
jgi:Ca-activated chloride channel homolog